MSLTTTLVFQFTGDACHAFPDDGFAFQGIYHLLKGARIYAISLIIKALAAKQQDISQLEADADLLTAVDDIQYQRVSGPETTEEGDEDPESRSYSATLTFPCDDPATVERLLRYSIDQVERHITWDQEKIAADPTDDPDDEEIRFLAECTLILSQRDLGLLEAAFQTLTIK